MPKYKIDTIFIRKYDTSTFCIVHNITSFKNGEWFYTLREYNKENSGYIESNMINEDRLEELWKIATPKQIKEIKLILDKQ